MRVLNVGLIIALFLFCSVVHGQIRRCFNLQPYEPILNNLLDAIPGRQIQDLVPLPLTIANGEEIWRKRIETFLCDLDVILDSVVLQVVNINFEKIYLAIQSKESIFLTIPIGIQATSRIYGDCGIYKPQVVNLIEFAATLSLDADICIELAALGNPAGVLNYTYATVNDVNYKADAQNFYWCIYDALPLLESIINDLIEENLGEIWKAIDNALQTLFPALEVVLNQLLQSLGIDPYNSTSAEIMKPFDLKVEPQPKKTEEKIYVIRTSNFSSLMYNDVGSGAWMDASFYRPSTTFSGYYPVGDYAQRNYDAAKGTVQLVKDDGVFVTKPVGFELIWADRGSGADRDGSIWKPIPPAGYVALGHVSQNGYNQPSVDVVRVVRSDFVVRCDPWLTWTDRCSGADSDVSIWSIAETTSPSTGVFISNNNYNRPSKDVLFCLDPEKIVLE